MSEIVRPSETLLPDGLIPWGDDRLADIQDLRSTESVIDTIAEAYGDNLGHLVDGYFNWRNRLKPAIIPLLGENVPGSKDRMRHTVRLAFEANTLPVLLEATGKKMPQLVITPDEKPIALSALAMAQAVLEVEGNPNADLKKSLLDALIEKNIGTGDISRRVAGATYDQLASVASLLFNEHPLVFNRYMQLASMIPDTHLALTCYQIEVPVADELEIDDRHEAKPYQPPIDHEGVQPLGILPLEYRVLTPGSIGKSVEKNYDTWQIEIEQVDLGPQNQIPVMLMDNAQFHMFVAYAENPTNPSTDVIVRLDNATNTWMRISIPVPSEGFFTRNPFDLMGGEEYKIETHTGTPPDEWFTSRGFLDERLGIADYKAMLGFPVK
jgi:hypothetical protein